jgi:hypothetical protein
MRNVLRMLFNAKWIGSSLQSLNHVIDTFLWSFSFTSFMGVSNQYTGCPCIVP